MKVVFISIARVLATFDILPPVDENGEPQMPSAKFTKEIIRYGEASHSLLCSADLISSGQSSHAVRLYRKTPNRKFDDSCHGGVGESIMIHNCLHTFPSFFLSSVRLVFMLFIVCLRAQKSVQQTESNTGGDICREPPQIFARGYSWDVTEISGRYFAGYVLRTEVSCFAPQRAVIPFGFAGFFFCNPFLGLDM